MTATAMAIDRSRILTEREIGEVVRRWRAIGGRRGLRNLAIFRLAACCGLRASEIAALNVGDLRDGSDRPHVHVRDGKGGKARRVPLWWDRETLEDLRRWRDERDAGPDEPFVTRANGKRLHRVECWQKWKSALACLGRQRVADLRLHDGRHSAISHWLAAGLSLPEVRDAAGHSNIAITNVYLHVVGGDDDQVREIWKV